MSLSPQAGGLLLGTLGVAIFSLTPPMTRLAVAALDPTLVPAVRIRLAAACAALDLAWTRAPWPSRADLPARVRVALAVVLGFALLTATR